MGKASGPATQRVVCIDKAVVLLGRTDIRLSCSGLKVICGGTADPKRLPCPITVSPVFSYRCSCLVPQVVSLDYCAMWPARYICSTIGQLISMPSILRWHRIRRPPLQLSAFESRRLGSSSHFCIYPPKYIPFTLEVFFSFYSL